MRNTLNTESRREMAFASNSWHPFSYSGQSSGSKSFLHNRNHPRLRMIQEMLPEMTLRKNDPDFEESVSAFLSDSGVAMISLNGSRDIGSQVSVSLGKKTPASSGLHLTLEKRQSIREFSGSGIPFAQVSDLLSSGLGCSRAANIPAQDQQGDIPIKSRPYPSAGGLYPVDLLLVAKDITDLPSGIYQYLPSDNTLVLMKPDGYVDSILDSLGKVSGSGPLDQCSALFFFKISWQKSVYKYGPMGLRFIFQETGAIAQNLNLLLAYHGLAGFEFASFYANELNDILGFDGVNVTIVHAMAIGNKI